MDRLDLWAWVIVHTLGLAVNVLGVLLALPLGIGKGDKSPIIVRCLQHTCAALINFVSLFTGTAVIEFLDPGVVWSYAIFQGVLFTIIGGGNFFLTLRERYNEG